VTKYRIIRTRDS